MEVPADTLNYMIAGYVVIFGTMLAYLVSYLIRLRNLRAEEKLLEELDENQDNIV